MSLGDCCGWMEGWKDEVRGMRGGMVLTRVMISNWRAKERKVRHRVASSAHEREI